MIGMENVFNELSWMFLDKENGIEFITITRDGDKNIISYERFGKFFRITFEHVADYGKQEKDWYGEENWNVESESEA